MPRLMVFAFFIAGLMFVLVPGGIAQEGTPFGSICVLAYEDINENSVRDAGEVPLPGVPVYVAIETDLIIQSYITTQDNKPYCFEGLTPGVYNLYFADSPNHRATTQNSAALSLEAAQRFRVEFGAVAQPALLESGTPEAVEIENSQGGQLDTVNRVLIAALGAFFVMIFMLGLGVVIASFIY